MTNDIQLLEQVLEDARRKTEEAIRQQQLSAEMDRLAKFLEQKAKEELVTI